MSETPHTAVKDNSAAKRYELVVGDETAFAAYERDGDALIFTHTIVPKGLEGQGIGSKLVAAALADVRAKGLRVRPLCSFVAGYMKRHPESDDLLDQQAK